MKRLSICLILLLAAGCSTPVTYVKLPEQELEKPVVAVPKQMHIRNWVDGNGSGSCVHASTLHLFQWQNMPNDFIEKWKREHAGGETARSIQEYYRRAGLKWTCTERGDPNFIDWASDNRYGAIIWWKRYHCCTLLGTWIHPEKGKLVAIYDNNYPGIIEYHKYDDFIRAWRGYGGFAATVLINPPATPLPWPIFGPLES